MKDRETSLIWLVLVAVVASVGVVGILVHLHNSLVDAVNKMATCEDIGGIDCHVERDGLEYNVYWRGE